MALTVNYQLMIYTFSKKKFNNIYIFLNVGHVSVTLLVMVKKEFFSRKIQ